MDLTDRATALDVVDRLVVDVQDGVILPPAAIADFIRQAEDRGWDEVVRGALYLQVISADRDGDAAALAAVERLLVRSVADGDVVMTAIALAKRARILTRSDDPASSVAADRDLARASVLLETKAGAPRERARGHVNCAIAYGQRDLWELEDEHYRAAEEALGEIGEQSRLLWAIRYNRAEVQLNWACALRELADLEGLEYRVKLASKAVAAAYNPVIPVSWRSELRIFASVLHALSPRAQTPPQRELIDSGECAGYVQLARALTLPDPGSALAEANSAIELISGDVSPNPHNLALCVAAELEAALERSSAAGLRYARHLARLRWAQRLSSLAAMQSLLQAERLRSEHAVLSQHAYLDDLTGLGNRRAMIRYVESLVAQEVSSVALVLVDIDRFKEVNDTFGHGVGDETLIRLAALLRGAVRAGDLAVRLGGDEFVLLLASTDIAAAARRAQTIVAEVAAEPWDEICSGLKVAASVGVACGDPEQLDELRATADVALYRSKAAGGACVSQG